MTPAVLVASAASPRATYLAADATPSHPPAPDVCVDAWSDVFCGSAVWPSGTYLYQQGHEADTVYLLESGFVKVVTTSEDGRELLVNLKFAPTIVGLTAAILGEKCTTTAIPGVTCRARYCAAPAFRAALASDARRVGEIQRLQSLENERLIARLSVIALKDAEGRFLDLLRSFCTRMPGSESAARLRLPLKHCEIASFIAVSPVHLSRVIAKLVERGVVCQHKGVITVPDVSRLHE